MNSLCFEQTRLSREATEAQQKLERPLKPQAVKPSASTNWLLRVITSRGHCSPKETRVGHCSLNNHSHLQPPQTEWKLITSRPLQPHFIRENKLYRWIKRRQICVGNNWQNKNDSIHFALPQNCTPLRILVLTQWNTETKCTCYKHVRKKVNADQQDQLSRKSFFSDSFTRNCSRANKQITSRK